MSEVTSERCDTCANFPHPPRGWVSYRGVEVGSCMSICVMVAGDERRDCPKYLSPESLSGRLVQAQMALSTRTARTNQLAHAMAHKPEPEPKKRKKRDVR